MLNSTEHELQLLIKTKIPTNEEVFALSLSDAVFIMLMSVKMPTIVGIVTFMSRIISCSAEFNRTIQTET